MLIPEKQRNRISFSASIVIHLLVFTLVTVSGVFGYNGSKHIEYTEVDLVSEARLQDKSPITGKSHKAGGGGGGGGGSITGHGTGDPNAAAVNEPNAVENGSAAVPDKDPIKTEDGMKAPENPGPPLATKSGTVEGADRGFGSGSGTGGGVGSGNGTGMGSGEGPGSGSGSGGGHGSGHGTGVGDGDGDGGEGADGEVVDDPAVPPRVTGTVAPYYPPALKNAGVEGVTVVQCIIGTDGSVESASVVRSSGNSTLDSSAVEAVEQWSFSPAKNSKGRKVRCYFNIPLRFRITYG